MSIPDIAKGRFAYHFTHIDNLESIIDNGLLCTNAKGKRRIVHQNVAEEGIQCRRSSMLVPCAPGLHVHDFVPFYFTKRSPMQLSVINKKNVDQALILYLAIPISIIETIEGVVFSDASANTQEPPKFYGAENVDQLTTLNWSAIDSNKWSWPDEDVRHQKMAELLVPHSVAITDISHIVVWNEWVKEQVEEIFRRKDMKCPAIHYDGKHYYTNFYDGERKSIVTGPRLLKLNYMRTVDEVCESLDCAKKYADVSAALHAIQENFSSITELEEINGLIASYWPHNGDVGAHSRDVANNLNEQPEYNALSQKDKELTKLSAYLHDIGKGPKSRWNNNVMSAADNDHAAKALPMLCRILAQEIGGLGREEVRKIVMLVTYDDLIGDILAKGRDEQQLFDIVTCENDLNMLIALSKSDMQAINPVWPIRHNNAINELKTRAINSLL